MCSDVDALGVTEASSHDDIFAGRKRDDSESPIVAGRRGNARAEQRYRRAGERRETRVGDDAVNRATYDGCSCLRRGALGSRRHRHGQGGGGANTQAHSAVLDA